MKTKGQPIVRLGKKNARIAVYLQSLLFLSLVIIISLLSCSSDEPQSNQIGEIKGTVQDESGNRYPRTSIVLFKEKREEITRVTQEDGSYAIKTKNIGLYEVEMKLPLSTKAIDKNPKSIDVLADVSTTVDFVIKPQPVKAHLNFGSVQLLEEIVDVNGNTPTSPSQPLYAKNNFDAPLGQLNAIKAPDGHHVTFSEFKAAKGEILVHCNGNTSTVEINLEGMIPNGTYTFWLAYLKRKVAVGENIDFANDFVNFNNPPIGASDGTENVVIAGADGIISTTLEHDSCILTDQVALVIPILYHLNGKTFGGGHVPDAEEMVHMLAYFQ